MVIDCDTCVVRGFACGDCVVTVLLGRPTLPGHPAVPTPTCADSTVPEHGTVVEIDADEHRALDVLAGAGMVPRLQLVRRAG